MQAATVLIMPLKDGFRAVVGGTVLDSHTLDGFGTRIESALRENIADGVEIDYALSGDIRKTLPPCSVCHGKERVELDGTVGAQMFEGVYSAIDFSKRATGTCPNCRGLGTEIPRFWQ
jgi:hypothetical protein